jgi:peroxiredoxin
MRFATSLLLAAVLTVTASAGAQTTEPRRSPSYTVQTIDGKSLSVESYRGKVVAIAFIHTECPHCQRTSQMLERIKSLHADTDLQVLAIALNADAAKLIPKFIERLAVTFPVAPDTQPNVRKYLGIANTGVVMPPALVIIDRAGMIQAEFGGDNPQGDDEAMVRSLIAKLVGSSAAPSSAARP